jgi:hypothetical protein
LFSFRLSFPPSLVIPAQAGIQFDLLFGLEPKRSTRLRQAGYFFAGALRRRSGANSEAGREAAEGRMPGVKK